MGMTPLLDKGPTNDDTRERESFGRDEEFRPDGLDV